MLSRRDCLPFKLADQSSQGKLGSPPADEGGKTDLRAGAGETGQMGARPRLSEAQGSKRPQAAQVQNWLCRVRMGMCPGPKPSGTTSHTSQSGGGGGRARENELAVPAGTWWQEEQAGRRLRPSHTNRFIVNGVGVGVG